MTNKAVATPTKPKPPGKKAEPLTPEAQRKAFEDAARELGCDESEERFDEALRAMVKQKSKDAVSPETKLPDPLV